MSSNYRDLSKLQSLSLEKKIELSKMTIENFYEWMKGKIYVSFSGGKDSTVLLHLIRNLFSNTQAIFFDTGLEYPEIREFIKTIDNVRWMKPKKSFYQVIQKYGYPVISKEQSLYIEQYRKLLSYENLYPQFTQNFEFGNRVYPQLVQNFNPVSL